MRHARLYPFLQIGVTGGIGSGKSTVCRLFMDIGRHVVFADAIAKRIADEDPEARRAILREFGPSAYLSDGSLDRKRMASLVFGDRGKRENLDSIIHPRVFKFIDDQLKSLPYERSFPYVLVEAALIFETGMEKELDHVIVVNATEDACIQRVVERDRVSPEDVRQRIAAQLPMTKKARQADFVIHNSGAESELRSAVLFLDSILSKMTPKREP